LTERLSCGSDQAISRRKGTGLLQRKDLRLYGNVEPALRYIYLATLLFIERQAVVDRKNSIPKE
jgi:hypothetical protein